MTSVDIHKIADFLEGIVPREVVLEKCADGVVFSKEIRETIGLIAGDKEIPAVILGETGTGKEEVAKLIHKRRCDLEGSIPFVSVNCATLDDGTAVSALFGHKRGAFTGADSNTVGLIGEANGGILFLDEIHTLSRACQQKLLRVLNDGKYQRLGETKSFESRFQVVAATTKDLDDEVEAGNFLLDLRMRITGVDISLLPLRERLEDLPMLMAIFFETKKVAISQIDFIALEEKCREYYWQGNVRLLFKVLNLIRLKRNSDRVVSSLPCLKPMLSPRQNSVETFSHGDFIKQSFSEISSGKSITQIVQKFEMSLIQMALLHHKKKVQAAIFLKISRQALNAKCRNL